MVATAAFFSGCVVGALAACVQMVPRTFQTPQMTVTHGGQPAFRDLSVKPNEEIAKATASPAEIVAPRRAFVPTREKRRDHEFQNMPTGEERARQGAPK